MWVISQESHDVLQHFKNLKLVVTCGRVVFINLISGNNMVRSIQVFTGYKKHSHIWFSVVHQSGTAKNLSHDDCYSPSMKLREGTLAWLCSFIHPLYIHLSIHPSIHPTIHLSHSQCWTISVKTNNNQVDLKLGWHIHCGLSLIYFRIFFTLYWTGHRFRPLFADNQ